MGGSAKGYRDGLLAEALAAAYLLCKGYRVVAKRYKTPVGEIDLVARRAGITVFIEVKARGTLEDALSAISDRQASRIIRASQHYAAKHPGVVDMRFDVVAVKLPFSVRHIESAFTA